jgi:hypothetical protein
VQLARNNRGSHRSAAEHGKPTQTKCSRLLLRVRSQSSTDPRDKIFAFQGLLNLLGIQLPAPDYDKPVAQVYREAAATSMLHDHSLMLLSALTGDSDADGLPSWVPDWSNNDIVNKVASWTRENAVGSSIPSILIFDNYQRLTIRGMILDTIDKVGSAYPAFYLLRPLGEERRHRTALQQEIQVLKSWFEMLSDRSSKRLVTFFTDFARSAFDEENVSVALNYDNLTEYWVTAIKLMSSYAYAEDRLPKSHHNTDLGFTAQRHVKANIVRFHTTLRKRLDRKRIFRTQGLILGVGFKAIQTGDKVALLEGCNLPMIVRESGSEWRMICPAYLKGAMQNCPAWASSTQRQDFTFI